MSTRIALIIGQLGLGGAEQQLYNLVSGLDRSCFRPLVLSLGTSADEYWIQPIRRLGIPVHHVSRALGRALRVLRIADILRCEKVQIVHGWVFHANPYAAMAGRLARIPLRFGSMRESYQGLPQERFLRWTGFRGLDVLITNSDANARWVKGVGATNSTIEMVPNGVSIPNQADQLECDRLKVELGLSVANRLIGSVGRLDRNKNYSMLLRAFALLAEKWPLLRLVIIGDGPLKSELTRLAVELGISDRVILRGTMPQAARFLPALDVCCLTSYTEGMPNLVMEAAAAGLPIVSTGCGDSAVLIEHGVSGYLVSVDDHASMSAHLGLLLSDTERRLRMGQAGREKMQREFGIDIMVSRMTHVYAEWLTRKGLV